jgi:hypothetical protein
MEINGTNYTVGADPEIFVGRNGQFVSAHGLVSGTKHNPLPVNGGAVQVDGMALEFNIDPANNFEEFQSNIEIVQSQLLSMIGDLSFLNVSTVTFEEQLLKEVPQENLMLGCEADFDAYEMTTNPRPEASSLMRTAGGHIHIGGFFTDNPNNPQQMGMSAFLARVLDKTIGVYSVLWDKDDARRAMYGKAGAFRPKSYGMEYRSASNAWLFNKGIMGFVYRGVEEALQNMFGGQELAKDLPSGLARRIINNSERDNTFFKNNIRAEEVQDLMGS